MRRRAENTKVVFSRGTAPARPLQRSRLAPAAYGRGWLRRDTRARTYAAPPDAQDHSARRRPGFAEGAAADCAGTPLLAGAGRFRQGRAASRLVGRSLPPGHAERNAPGGGERDRGLVRGEVGEDRYQFGRVAAPRVVDADVGVLDH